MRSVGGRTSSGQIRLVSLFPAGRTPISSASSKKLRGACRSAGSPFVNTAH